MKKIAFVLFLLSFSALGQKIEYNLSIPSDTTKNYYVAIYPKDEIKGVLILLPGFGELPQQTLIESDIYKIASEAGFLTIIPALGDRSFFYIDNNSHKTLDIFIEKVFRKYRAESSIFFIGGHSFGGTMAVQYAQRAYSLNSTLIKPAAVFAVDPPLDIERLYNCMTTENRPIRNSSSIQEDTYISNRIKMEFGTDPKSNPEFFWNVSPYSQSQIKHNSLQTLLEVPIRIYNEPDINWYLDNRNIDFYCINSIDGAAMINWLKNFGNQKAELIITSKKGYRVGSNMRHPHSWSIVDAKELVDWLSKNRL